VRILKPCFTVLFALALLAACGIIGPDSKQPEDVEFVGITKWYNGYHAVYTPTLDDGPPAFFEVENEWLIEHGLFMDYEIVSDIYDRLPQRLAPFLERLIPNGFGYFGHGHAHDNHDLFTYEESLASFTKNFERMESYGFKPVAYAYPYGAGIENSTVQALKDSGFLSGRLHRMNHDGYGPCVMPGDELEPPDWFRLPTLTMQSIDFEQRADYINNPDEFFSYFEPCIAQGGWVNSTYHAIGHDGINRPVAWGFYYRDHFYTEMLRVKELVDEGVLWLAQLNHVTLYTYQRNAAEVRFRNVENNEFELLVNDNLDRIRFNHELTLRFNLSKSKLSEVQRVIVSNSSNNTFKEIDITRSDLLLNLVPSSTPYTMLFIAK